MRGSVDLMRLWSLAVGAMVSVAAYSLEEETIELDQVTCAQFLSADAAEAHDILVFHHGYIKGMKDETTIRISELAAISDQVGALCTANPDMVVLEVFKSVKQL